VILYRLAIATLGLLISLLRLLWGSVCVSLRGVNR